jgi:hypothetical protein
MTGSPVVLVSESSATHCLLGADQAHNAQAINRIHLDLVRFSRRDKAYTLVLGFLHEFADTAATEIEARFRAAEGTHARLLLPSERYRTANHTKFVRRVNETVGIP